MKHHKSFPDASRIRTAENGDWFLTLPDGSKESGSAESEDEALLAAEQVRNNWILSTWNRGRWGAPSNPRRWVVPMP